jgi:DNA-binding MarR family transcriptional regulator
MLESGLEKQRQLEAFDMLSSETVAFFHSLRALAEKLHRSGHWTAAKRSILLNILHSGPHTVPQMASARKVSRQAIQKVINELLKEQLVTLQDNPHHKRSKLVALTQKGEQFVQMMLNREAMVMNQVEFPFPPEQLQQLAQSLRQIRRYVDQQLKQIE